MEAAADDDFGLMEGAGVAVNNCIFDAFETREDEVRDHFVIEKLGGF